MSIMQHFRKKQLVKKMDVISLASGCGLFDAALEDAGCNIRLQCECNSFALKVLNKRFPNSIKDYNIFKLTWEKINETYKIKDTRNMVIVGGLCCQPFSSGGPARGQLKETWMCEQLVRLTNDLRPRFTLVENVAGFIGHVDGAGWLQREMAHIGYSGHGICFPAYSVGSPQKRERVFYLFSRDRISSGVVPDTFGKRWDTGVRTLTGCLGKIIPGVWNERISSMPGISRVVNGAPSQDEIDYLRIVGNAVVYDVGYLIGKSLIEINDICYGPHGLIH